MLILLRTIFYFLALQHTILLIHDLQRFSSVSTFIYLKDQCKLSTFFFFAHSIDKRKKIYYSPSINILI